MNVLWTKEKRRKFNTNNAAIHAAGDGVVSGRCCRICSGEMCLKYFSDSHNVGGAEERYDELLYNCFGVRVSPSDSFICEWCVRQLRRVVRFQTLVLSAFGEPTDKMAQTETFPLEEDTKKKNNGFNDDTATLSYKDIIDLLKATATYDNKIKKKKVQKDIKNSTKTDTSKPETYGNCAECKQLYLRDMSTDSGRDMCKNCRKNTTFCSKCHVTVPHGTMVKHMHMHEQIRSKLRWKNRFLGLPRKLSEKPKEIHKDTSLPKFKCLLCPKKYMSVQHLAEHAKCMHCVDKSFCAMCGKSVKRNESLVKHLESHTKTKNNGKRDFCKI